MLQSEIPNIVGYAPSKDAMNEVGKNIDSAESAQSTPQSQSKNSSRTNSTQNSPASKKNALFMKRDKTHSIHNFDSTIMGGFYEASLSKFQETYPKWQDNWQCKDEPLVLSNKQKVFDLFKKFACESKEPLILLPNFDYGDVLNFERFLHSLKQDGINSIGKYKQYLNNKDVKKFDIDLALVHAKYGILLFEICDTDHLDSKRRGKAKTQLNSARSCLENLTKLIVESKGLPHDTTIPVTEIIALPNVQEKPQSQSSSMRQPLTVNQKPTSPTAALRQLQFLIKSDINDQQSFSKWWTETIVEKAQARQTPIDMTVLNYFTGIISAIKNNSVLPVVHEEHKLVDIVETKKTITEETTTTSETSEQKPEQKNKEQEVKVTLNVCAEFFHEEHEKVRSLSKVIVSSKDTDKIRRTTCLQILWLLLNDSQKKVSVVCSEQNKAHYEEYFSRQRKLYSNLNNVRFYSDLQSCPTNSNNTIKKDGEMWFFDCSTTELNEKVVERAKELHSFWIYTHDDMKTSSMKSVWDSLNVKYVDLDYINQQSAQEAIEKKPWLSGLHLKLPLRLSCDLLIIGDIVSQAQLKLLQTMFKSGPAGNPNGQHYNNQNGQQPSLASKKLKSIKFIRGGTIENLRTSIKMHDSIQAQVVLMHVGDEDVFKTRNSQTTVDRVKELASLVKEYCPKSFVVLSTLMRRVSKSENSVTNEVNKGIINFCKQTRESSNFFYMLNNHFDPEYHTYEGRVLSNKGLRLYVDNILFVVDYFLVKSQNSKQGVSA